MNDSFRRGVRLGLPFALVAFLLSMSFGVLAVQSGFSPLQAIVMSAVVNAGSAQFAATAIVAGGGGLMPGVLAAGLMNARYLAMGVALAPSLKGGAVTRGLQAQTVVDPSWVMANRGDGTFDRWLLFGATSWVMANRGDGTFDRWLLFGATAPQYVGWVTGTLVGAIGGDLVGDTDRFGLDAVFPTFFLGLLLAELRDRRSRWVALLGAAIALVLVPFTPAGIPILVAAAAALVGLGRSGGVVR